MRQYKYTAYNMNKEKVHGVYFAENKNQLGIDLAKIGLYIISARELRNEKPNSFFTLTSGKVKISEIVVFCNQLSVILSSGVNLADGMELLKNQSFGTYFGKIISVMCADIKGGMMLSDAAFKHKSAFPSFFCNMIKVGESGGRLDLVMKSLGEYYEKDDKIRRKARQALSYPLMLLFLTVAIVFVILLFVIPRFKTMLKSLDMEATGITKAIYGISDFLINDWYFVIAGLILIFAVSVAFFKSPAGKKFSDRLKLTLPVYKGVYTDIYTSRFARAMSLLLTGGMNLNEALNEISLVFNNSLLEEKFRLATEEVRHGISLSVAFEDNKIFPKIMNQMVDVGEKTASLDEIFGKSADFFGNNAENSLNSAVSKIQPAMLIILGVIIVFLFIAVYAPMMSMMQML